MAKETEADYLINGGTCIVFYGTVRDANTGEPIGGAAVGFGTPSTQTGADGNYRINLACPTPDNPWRAIGTTFLNVSRAGYVTASPYGNRAEALPAARTQRIDVALQPALTSMIVVVMGVSGSGKSTIGKMLATELNCSFQEGDALHPAANIAKMSRGTPLTDEDRRPWLAAIHSLIRDFVSRGEDLVVACSALKQAISRVPRHRCADYLGIPSRPEGAHPVAHGPANLTLHEGRHAG